VLRAAALGLPNVVNSHYYAEIDPELCTACGICADARCQVKAIRKGEDSCRVVKKRCIGCGLCVTTCPAEAIRMVHKKPEDRTCPPQDENAWLEERARIRGVDFTKYK
jgi:ferredoxin